VPTADRTRSGLSLSFDTADDAGSPGSAPAVEIWLVDLARSAVALLAIDADVPYLPAEDRQRAMALGIGGNHRLAGYIALRLVLERHAGTHVRQRPFARSPLGRPSLPGFDGDFSLSHAGGLALIGVSRTGTIGVDIERPRLVRMSPPRRAAIVRAAALLMRHTFQACDPAPAPAPTDSDAGDAGAGRQPPSDAVVLRAWVRLEAFAKARSTSIARVLDAAGALGQRREAVAASADRELVARFAALGPGRPDVVVLDLATPCDALAACAVGSSASCGVSREIEAPAPRLSLFPATHSAIMSLIAPGR